jgi:3-(3-hydroxy-phenyl)propionate hydroxylase
MSACANCRSEGKPIEMRGGNKVVSVTEKDDGVALSVDTPDGPYRWRPTG